MVDDEFTYKDLRRIHHLEKHSAVPTPIETSFYSKIRGYIKKLEYLIDEVESLEKRELVEDELKNAKQAFQGIYELREKKIVQASLSKVRGGSPNPKNLIGEEKKLFDALVENLKEARRRILVEVDKEKPSEDVNHEDVVETKEKEGSQGKIAEGVNQTRHPNEGDRSIIMVKEDIPTFVGTDMRQYRLRQGDVVSLPHEMGETLKKRGVAEKIR
ncbi:MAG TPA: DNA replication complex GINS family protein [Thermoplasmata archaeon]|nr:DNA replication complex GINS family protein [Thermoplasmata archaeon]